MPKTVLLLIPNACDIWERQIVYGLGDQLDDLQDSLYDGSAIYIILNRETPFPAGCQDC